MEDSRYQGLHQMIVLIMLMGQIMYSEEAYSERYILKAPGENTGNSLISRMKYINDLDPIPIWGKNLMEYYIMMEYPEPPETVNNLGLRMNLLGAQSSDLTSSSHLFQVVEDTIHHTFTITFSVDISEIMMCSVTQIAPTITDYSCHIQIQFVDLEGSEEGRVLSVHNTVLTVLLNNTSKVEVGIGGGDALNSCDPDTCQIKQVQTRAYLCESNGCAIREEIGSEEESPKELVVDIPFSVFLGIPPEEDPTRYNLQLLQVIWTNQDGEQKLNGENSCVQNNTYTDIKYEEGGAMTFSCTPSTDASNVYLKILAQITPISSLRTLNTKTSAILGLAGPYIIYPKGHIISTLPVPSPVPPVPPPDDDDYTLQIIVGIVLFLTFIALTILYCKKCKPTIKKGDSQDNQNPIKELEPNESDTVEDSDSDKQLEGKLRNNKKKKLIKGRSKK